MSGHAPGAGPLGRQRVRASLTECGSPARLRDHMTHSVPVGAGELSIEASPMSVRPARSPSSRCPSLDPTRSARDQARSTSRRSSRRRAPRRSASPAAGRQLAAGPGGDPAGRLHAAHPGLAAVRGDRRAARRVRRERAPAPGPRSAGWPAAACWRAAGRAGNSFYRLTEAAAARPVGRRQLGRRVHDRRAGRGTDSGRSSPSPCRRSAARSAEPCAVSCGGWDSRRCTTDCGSPRTASPRKAKDQLAQLTSARSPCSAPGRSTLDAMPAAIRSTPGTSRPSPRSTRSFLRRWRPLLPRIRVRAISGAPRRCAPAPRSWTPTAGSPSLDPRLPLELLPPGGCANPPGRCSPLSTTAWPRRPRATYGRSWPVSPTARPPASRPTASADSSPAYARTPAGGPGATAARPWTHRRRSVSMVTGLR